MFKLRVAKILALHTHKDIIVERLIVHSTTAKYNGDIEYDTTYDKVDYVILESDVRGTKVSRVTPDFNKKDIFECNCGGRIEIRDGIPSWSKFSMIEEGCELKKEINVHCVCYKCGKEYQFTKDQVMSQSLTLAQRSRIDSIFNK